MGITRRIDELGRIVVPKELRDKLRIGEGSVLEFSVANDELVLKKYNAISDIYEILSAIVRAAHANFNALAFVVSESDILCSCPPIEGAKLPEVLKSRFERKQREIELEIGGKLRQIVVTPIIHGGDYFGSVCLETGDGEDRSKICAFCAGVISALYDT